MPETEYAVRAEDGIILPRPSQAAAQATVDSIRAHGGPAALASRQVTDWAEVGAEPTCTHDGLDVDVWFDRTICPDPCGSMHQRCTSCGAPTEPCPAEEEL